MVEESKTRRLAELVVLLASLRGDKVDGLFPVHTGIDEIVLDENRYKLRAAHAIDEREYGEVLEVLQVIIKPTDENTNGDPLEGIYFSKGLTDECHQFAGTSNGKRIAYNSETNYGLEHADKVGAVVSVYFETLLAHYEKATENVHSYVAQVREENDCYLVEFPDIPEVTTHGKTPEDALGSAREALSLHLAVLIGDDEPIPTPEYQFGNAPEGMRDMRVTVDVTSYLSDSTSDIL